MPRVVETTFRNPANQRHLAAFESNTNRTAGTGGLPFAAPAGCFAVPAGFTLAKAFATMLGAGVRF
jgi:hypothetical protein